MCLRIKKKNLIIHISYRDGKNDDNKFLIGITYDDLTSS